MLGQEKYVRISGKRRKPLIIFFSTFALLVVLFILGWAFRIDLRLSARTAISRRADELSILWDGRAYTEIITLCEEYLVEDSMDPVYLAFLGFSSFYKADEIAAVENKMPYLDQAVTALRRARLAPDQHWTTEIDYVLGKAYFHKGVYYYDLAVRYLAQAMENGYKGKDTYDYLGAAYVRLGEHQRGLEYFLRAIEESPNDALYLTVAMVYFQLEDMAQAAEYFIRAKNATVDPEVGKKARHMLGGIYLQRREYFKAEQEYQEVLELDPDSADAYFGLGEVYRLSGEDEGKARKMYREALRHDPSHVGAKLQYYGR